MKNYKILYCDLDGTLINTVTGEKFPKGIWDMAFNFEVLKAIKQLAPEFVFVVSNQGGIEKGFVDAKAFCAKKEYITACLREYLGMDEKHVGFAYCTSNNKNEHCRKPNVGMLEYLSEQFIQKHNPAPQYCNADVLMIGDASGKPGQFSDSDKQTADNFGCDYMDIEDFVNESECSARAPILVKVREVVSEVMGLKDSEIWDEDTLSECCNKVIVKINKKLSDIYGIDLSICKTDSLFEIADTILEKTY